MPRHAGADVYEQDIFALARDDVKQTEKLGAALGGPAAPRRILLLQGPVGPFFKRLQLTLEARGADVRRVVFNAGDGLFAPKQGCLRFSGTRNDWTAYLQRLIEDWQPDCIILFGCKRPAHLIATKLAAASNIPLYALEEGYIRSGYVACELGGNNDLSPLQGLVPSEGDHIIAPEPAHLGPTFKAMSFWGFCYYASRQLFSKPDDRHLFHRLLVGPFRDTGFWLNNALRLFFKKRSESRQIRQLCADHDRDFLLVPLQMPSDSQMGKAANGWSIDRLIEAVITSFTLNRPTSRLVFKIHPLDGEAPFRERLIRQTAQRLGVSEDVDIFHSGSIAELTTHSDGMIVINSTCGFTAIHHGTPLLVLGKALFRNPAIAMCGDDEAAIDDFMGHRFAADEETRRRYLKFVTQGALLPGDFYVENGMTEAAINIANRVLNATPVNAGR